MMNPDLPCTSADLAGFREAQRMAYACATEVASQLKEGMTEVATAALMRTYLADHHVRHYFHAPFVWFGDRTALSTAWGDEEFLPTKRCLAPGMPVIVDVAPVVGGYAADIGYTFNYGDTPAVDKMLHDLAGYREMIPKAIREGYNLQQVYQMVDEMIAKQGYQSSHHAYPAGVIGHRVARLATGEGDEALAGGFGKAAFRFLVDKKQQSKQDPAESPYWNGTEQSAHAPHDGLWAVEPHLGAPGMGVKFEELLVVEGQNAYWLDDDLPHVNRWRAL